MASELKGGATVAGYQIWHGGNLQKSEFSAFNHNHTLDSLSNVTITGAASGQVIRWNGSAWVNVMIAASDIPDATTSAKGVVQLYSATDSTSTTLAATASAVKSAYDLANGKQASDAGLTALAGIATNGLLARTGAGVAAARSLAVSGTGLSVSNADGAAGNPTITSNATNANTGSAIVARDGSGNFSAGTITATLSGNASTATKVSATATGANVVDLVYAAIADNDYFRIRAGGTATNTGFAEIATADDGTEPIYVRQYTGVFTTLTRTATLLDASGNTSFPGTVTAPTFSGALSGNASTATKWAAAQTITLGGDLSGSVSMDGSANVTLTANVADDSHTHNKIVVLDTRAVVDGPQNLQANAISGSFKAVASVANPPITASGGSFAHVINVSGWSSTEPSGGWPSQISVGDGLAVRTGTSATAWGPWRKLLDDSTPIGFTTNTYRNTVTTAGSATTVNVGITDFIPTSDSLLVFQNTTFLQEGTDYTLASDGTSITKLSGNWIDGTTLNFVAFVIRKVNTVTPLVSAKSYHKTVITTANQSTISISIPEYIKSEDTLMAYQNGVLLYNGTHYSIDAGGSNITLTGYTADANDEMRFVVFKGVQATYL